MRLRVTQVPCDTADASVRSGSPGVTSAGACGQTKPYKHGWPVQDRKRMEEVAGAEWVRQYEGRLQQALFHRCRVLHDLTKQNMLTPRKISLRLF